jgi:hypothetical protein
MKLSDPACDRVEIVAYRLVETNHLPAEFSAGEIALLVATLPSIAAMPPARARFHGKPDRRPDDVEMDHLAVCERQRVLPHRIRESEARKRVDEIYLRA